MARTILTLTFAAIGTSAFAHHETVATPDTMLAGVMAVAAVLTVFGLLRLKAK